jgi:uncharacterized protein DUF6894
MRCYFHLVTPYGLILDETGVEVPDLEAAEAEALRAIQELRDEDSEADDDLSRCQLNITDRSGRVLLSISLDSAQQNRRFTQIGHDTWGRMVQLHIMFVCVGLYVDWMNLVSTS